MKTYLLNDQKNPYPVTLEEFVSNITNDMRNVKVDHIDDVVVSTVFLGMDHAWLDESAPILFETMIFGGKHDDFQRRYSTYNEALEGHESAVQLVKNNL